MNQQYYQMQIGDAENRFSLIQLAVDNIFISLDVWYFKQGADKSCTEAFPTIKKRIFFLALLIFGCIII